MARRCWRRPAGVTRSRVCRRGAAAKVAAYVDIIDRIGAVAHGDVEEVIGTVLEASGYRASLAESDDEQDQNRLANIEELLTDARQFDEQNPGGGGLEEYLERTWLVNETDNWDTETDKATLMTLHAAKGLEFPIVFIVAVEDGVLPHERVGQHPDELEEERRLAFVGITRAKEELQLSYAVTRDFRGVRRRTIPSSFLMEMPRDEMEMIDSAGGFDAAAMNPWDDLADDDDDDTWDDWQIEDVAVAGASGDATKPAVSVVAATIKTAAMLSRELTEDPDAGAGQGAAARFAGRVQAGNDRGASGVWSGKNRGTLGRRQKPPGDDSIRDRGAEEDHLGAQHGAAGFIVMCFLTIVSLTVASRRVYPGGLVDSRCAGLISAGINPAARWGLTLFLRRGGVRRRWSAAATLLR